MYPACNHRFPGPLAPSVNTSGSSSPITGATGFSLILRRGDSEIGGKEVGRFRGVVPREGLGVGPLDHTPVTLIGVGLVRLKKRVSASSRASLVSRVPYSPSTNSSQAFLVSGCQTLLWCNSGGGIAKPYRSRAGSIGKTPQVVWIALTLLRWLPLVFLQVEPTLSLRFFGRSL